MARQETQQEVASAVGIHRTHLSRIEGGGENITVDTLWALADYLGVAAGELMTDASARDVGGRGDVGAREGASR